jgi:hypothetical protein
MFSTISSRKSLLASRSVWLRRTAAAAILSGALWFTATGTAQAPANGLAHGGPDISGLWLIQDPGSGDWSSFWENVPKPALTDAIIKMNAEDKARVDATNGANQGEGGPQCPVGNLAMMMGSSGPLNIVQGRDEVLIGSEAGRGRIIYMDGRGHEDVKSPSYITSGVGHSVGHWEGNTLVVDTVGFAPKVCDSRWPIMRAPGGGRVKETTHLVERINLSPDGKELKIALTWDDPSIYLKPHAYSYTYKLIPEGTPMEGGNDLSDAAYVQRTKQSVIPPPQK